MPFTFVNGIFYIVLYITICYIMLANGSWEVYMLVNVVGYNRFDYTNKDGEAKQAVKFFCVEANHSEKITSGVRTFEVFSSLKYAKKITEGIEAGQAVHVGWGEKDKRAFLYLK